MVKYKKGFSLLEMLIVVSIISILMISSVPFTLEAYYKTQLKKAYSSIQTSFTKTKSIALQNKNQKSFTEPSAILCIKNNIIYVYDKEIINCGEAEFKWKNDFSGNSKIDIYLNNVLVQEECIALNNESLPVNASVNSKVCSKNRNFKIKKEDILYEFVLY